MLIEFVKTGLRRRHRRDRDLVLRQACLTGRHGAKSIALATYVLTVTRPDA